MSLTVSITGGRGFLGTYVTRELERRGARVRPLGSADGDLRDPRTAMAMLQDADRVVHLAADVGGVGYLRAQAGRVYHDNMRIGLNVVRAACAGRASRLVVASSPCCYAAEAPLPLREDALEKDAPSGDTAAYAFSKLGTSAAADAMCAAAGKDAVSFIPSNLYGPGDKFCPSRSHVVAALLRKALVAAERGDPTFDVWGDGTATRDFVYVEDVAAAVAEMTLRERAFAAPVYNLGSGVETSIATIANVIAEIVSPRLAPSFSPEKPVGYVRRVLSIARSSEELGYRPGTSLRDGIARTVRWLRESGMVARMAEDAAVAA